MARKCDSGFVLIVDDDEDVRFTLSECLQGYGYRTDIADSASRAAAMIQEWLRTEDAPMPQTLITDFEMPELSGVELIAEWIGSAKWRPGFILMTGAPEMAEAQLRQLKVSGVQLVAKPCCILDLLKLLPRSPDPREIRGTQQ